MSQKVQLILKRNMKAPKSTRFYDIIKRNVDFNEDTIPTEQLETDPEAKKIGGVILKKDEYIGGVTFKIDHGEKITPHSDVLIKLYKQLIEKQEDLDELTEVYFEIRDAIKEEMNTIKEDISRIEAKGEECETEYMEVKTLGQKIR